MRCNSIIDEKRKQQVREARERGDSSVFAKKKRMPSPMVEPVSGIDWSKLDRNSILILTRETSGITAFEAAAHAKEEELIIIPNVAYSPRYSRILSGFWYNTLWTGTALIHEAPDAPFGDKVVGSYLMHTNNPVFFNVPSKFRGKKNCALVVEHPDLEFKRWDTSYEFKVNDESRIHLLEDFPGERGVYKQDDKFGIPIGERFGDVNVDVTQYPTLLGNSNVILYRSSGPYIGLISRESNRWMDINTDSPFTKLEALAVSREAYESLKRGGGP